MFDLTVQDFNGEPRMRDVDIAEALGFERARKIRDLINRCRDQLMGFGEVIRATVARPTAGRANKFNPDAQEYWLNEHQAFYLCTQSKAKRALEVTQQIINVFVAWRHDRLPPPEPDPAPLAAVTPDMMDIASLVREARLTHGRTAGQILWRKMGMPELPVEPAAPVVAADDAGGDDLLLFLHEAFVFTGNQSDFVRSRAVYQAYCAFMDGEPPLGQRALSSRLHALAPAYRCPTSGKRFWPGKSSNTGYRGLRLIA